MRIILSRKGFDSAAGGCPSPILPGGRLLSLPIPLGPSPCSYADLSHEGRPLGEIVEDLTRSRISGDVECHLDPDLRRDARDRPEGWRPIFGQAGPALSHLTNQGVGKDDLFLFFGWFRQTVREQGRLRFAPGAPDLHVFFGWLQVGQVVESPDAFAREHQWAHQHPHVQADFGPPNGIFVATEQLSGLGLAKDLPGAGTFHEFRPTLQLTAPGENRGIWNLPSWFWRESPDQRLSYHAKRERWVQKDDGVQLRTVGRGQEFVMELPGGSGPGEWLGELFDSL